MSVPRQATPQRQTANRCKVSEIPYSIAFNQAGGASQNCALSAMDTFITGLPGGNSVGFWMKGADKESVPAYILGGSALSGSTYCFVGLNRLSTTLGRINFQMRDVGGHQLAIESTKPVLNGKWHHVVFTKTNANTAATMKVYIDGVQTSQTTIASQAFDDPAALGRTCYLGSAGNGGSSFFKGLLADFGLWQRELTALEVSDWFKNNQVPSNAYRFYSSADSPVITTQLYETVAADHGVLDSVNMWSDQSPRGRRKSANLFN